MDLQFHLEAFEFMMILSFVNKKVDHASSPWPLPPFLSVTIPKLQKVGGGKQQKQVTKSFLKENKCM